MSEEATNPKQTGYLKFEGWKYPLFRVNLGKYKLDSTKPLIQNGDTTFTAKPSSELNSTLGAYEVVRGTPSGRSVTNLWGDTLGIPDSKAYEEILKQFGIKLAPSLKLGGKLIKRQLQL